LIPLLAALILMAEPAQAGGRSSCKEPLVFGGANVNIMVLPYTYVGQDLVPLSRTGEKLALLIQLDSLFTMLKYHSIGVVSLMMVPGEDPKECESKVVLNKIMGKMPGAVDRIQPKKAVALLWGRIYEEGKDVYVQSFLRFLRRDIVEGIKFDLRSRDGTPLELVGRLPSQAFAFAPRRLTTDDLGEIEKEFERSAIVRPRPEESAPGYQMELDSLRPFTYYVTDARKDWMKIDSFSGGRSGWIRAQVDSTWPLRKKLPELDFLDAVVGYLQYRIGNDSGLISQPSLINWVDRGLTRYEGNSGPERASLSTAVGKILRGFLMVLEEGSRPKLAAIDRFQKLSAEAVALIPFNADARNLEIMARIYRLNEGGIQRTDISTLAEELQSAIIVNPKNSRVLANFENFYLFLSSVKGAEIPFKRSEIDQKIQAVRGVRTDSGADINPPMQLKIQY
jgi:hypothetical protein